MKVKSISPLPRRKTQFRVRCNDILVHWVPTMVKEVLSIYNTVRIEEQIYLIKGEEGPVERNPHRATDYSRSLTLHSPSLYKRRSNTETLHRTRYMRRGQTTDFTFFENRDLM